MMTTLLGGLSPTRFLRDVRHKRPLLIRNAVPGFTGLLSPGEMHRRSLREHLHVWHETGGLEIDYKNECL